MLLFRALPCQKIDGVHAPSSRLNGRTLRAHLLEQRPLGPGLLVDQLQAVLGERVGIGDRDRSKRCRGPPPRPRRGSSA